MSARILLPTDYSPGSRRAYRIALSLAANRGLDVDILHAWSAPFFGSGYEVAAAAGTHASLFTLIREQAEKEMAEFVASAEVPEGVTVTTRVVSGEPVHATAEMERERETELVVVGSHGRTGARYLLLGSVAARLVQTCHAPVLVIPAHEDGEESPYRPRRIVVAVDFSDATSPAIAEAVRVASRFGATVELLHVIAPPSLVVEDLTLWDQVAAEHRTAIDRQIQELARGVAAPEGVQVEHRVDFGVPADVIVAAAERAELIVVGTHGRTGLSRLLLGSVAEKVSRASPCPVLAVKARPA